MAQVLTGPASPLVQFFSDAGAPLAGGFVYTYAAGSTTPQPTFSDAAGLVPNSNPITLDAAGKAVLYLSPVVYKFDVQNSAGVSQDGYPRDNITGSLWTGALIGASTLSPAINANGFANRITSTINKAGSGTHPIFAGLAIDPPTIGAGAAALSEADTLYISAAPIVGTSLNAIHVAAGLTKLDGSVQAPFVSSSANSVLTITSNTIVPTGSVHHVGAGLIKTITVPVAVVGPWVLWLIPDAAFTWDSTGNITLRAGGGTAVINQAIAFVWDGVKFNATM
jgi:hypothetical protein